MTTHARVAVLATDSDLDGEALRRLGEDANIPLEFVRLNGGASQEQLAAEVLAGNYDAVVVTYAPQSAEGAATLDALVRQGYTGALIVTGPNDAGSIARARAAGAAEYVVEGTGSWAALPLAVKSALLERSLLNINAFKDQFISVASHELKNPLAALRGYAELLLRRAQREQSDERSLRGLSIIIQQSLRMQRILDDLHELARLNRGLVDLQGSEIELEALLQRAAAAVVYEGEAAPVELPDLDPGLRIVGDVERLAHSLGRVMTLLSSHSPANVPVLVQVADAGAAVRIDICGQSGLRPADLDEAFSHFYSAGTSSRINATERLSLFVCAELIRLHGGAIAFENSPEGESVVRITLPRPAQT